MNTCVWEIAESGYVCPNCKVHRKVKVVRVCRPQAEQNAEIAAYNARKRANSEQRKKSQEFSGAETSLAIMGPNKYWVTVTKPFRYVKAIAKWLYFSAKARRWLVRDEMEYLRVRKICENCPHDQWNAEKEECKICGCGGRSKVVLLNKLRLSTEKCPKGEW